MKKEKQFINVLHSLLEKENLIITEAYVNQGPILKRVRPRAQGRAFAIQKKMSHVTIKVAEI